MISSAFNGIVTVISRTMDTNNRSTASATAYQARIKRQLSPYRTTNGELINADYIIHLPPEAADLSPADLIVMGDHTAAVVSGVVFLPAGVQAKPIGKNVFCRYDLQRLQFVKVFL